MSRLTLLHRDLSRRIESLKQIVEASQDHHHRDLRDPMGVKVTGCSGPLQRGNVGDMHSIDLNPNTNQLIIKYTRRRHYQSEIKPRSLLMSSCGLVKPSIPLVAQRGDSLDEGFESDVDTISLVSTESTVSLMTKIRETDSANGSASSDSDDSEASKNQVYPSLEASGTTSTSSPPSDKNQPKDKIVTEYFNLVNCVCYTDSAHPDVLILVVSSAKQEEETLVFRFENPKELEAFHENFSTVKAVANQKNSSYAGTKPFNLLQRTDSDGMTHIRISRQDDYQDQQEEDFTSILSLPNISQESAKPRFEKFATIGKPTRKRILKKSKSIEDFLDSEKPLRKIWNSAENILDLQDLKDLNHLKETKPKAPPRKGRKKGPAPPPPNLKALETDIAQGRNLSTSFTSLHLRDPANMEDKTSLGLGNVFQGQFVRVQVDHSRAYTNFPMLMNFRPKTGPEILKYESLDTWKPPSHESLQRVKHFDAFKFSDLTGYQQQKEHSEKAEKPERVEKAQNQKPSMASRGFSALKLYIPMYKSAKKQSMPGQTKYQGPIQGSYQGVHPTTQQPAGNFTNRLFGMSSKLKEFGSLQSDCNPDQRYRPANGNPYAPPGNLGKDHNEGKFFGKLGRLGRSGSLGNLTLLANNEKVQSNTLKSVIKKRDKDDVEGRKFGRHGKKVTFSAYNTVQVV